MADVEKLNEVELIELARLFETPVGLAIRKLLANETASAMEVIRSRPRINTENVKDDFRYVLGRLKGMELIPDMAAEALRVLSQNKQEGARA